MPDGQPREMIETVLDGFRALRPGGVAGHVTHAAPRSNGSCRTRPARPIPDGQPRPPISRPAPVDPAAIAEAVAAARAADVAVVVVGDTVALTGESRSTATLELQGGQLALLDGDRRDAARPPWSC